MRLDDIKKNWAKCRLCDDVIESVHRHDFQTCKCGEIFIDGGNDYQRYGCMTSMENIAILDESGNEVKREGEDATV